jgi:tetratricopeptide (TPR) repeat protein
MVTDNRSQFNAVSTDEVELPKLKPDSADLSEAVHAMVSPSNHEGRNENNTVNDQLLVNKGFPSAFEILNTDERISVPIGKPALVELNNWDGRGEPRDTRPPSDSKPESKPAPLTKFEKKVSDLIEKLGDDDFSVRQKAQKDLVDIGSGAYQMLEKALKNDDLEIRHRASKAMAEIVKNPPKAGPLLNEARDQAQKELEKDGKISKETDEKYRKLTADMSHQTMSPEEYVRRTDALKKTAYDRDAKLEDRLKAHRDLGELAAMLNTPPNAQVRFDHAEMLLKSGEKAKAAEVLKEAVKADPALARHSTFAVLAVDSGATKDKTFMDAVDAATGKPGQFKSRVENPRALTSDRVEKLENELRRWGPTERLEKEVNALIDSFAKQQEKNPDQKTFLNIQQGDLQKGLADAFINANKGAQATKVLTRMLADDPGWADSAWMNSASTLSKANEDDTFNAALKEARKRAPRR